MKPFEFKKVELNGHAGVDLPRGLEIYMEARNLSKKTRATYRGELNKDLATTYRGWKFFDLPTQGFIGEDVSPQLADFVDHMHSTTHQNPDSTRSYTQKYVYGLFGLGRQESDVVGLRKLGRLCKARMVEKKKTEQVFELDSTRMMIDGVFRRIPQPPFPLG